MGNKNFIRFFLALVIVVSMCHSIAFSGDYPEKPITLIIPFGAGGSHDLNARVFSSVIPQYLGQPMVVKLMPGAGGQTGTAAAIKAKPDGYTLIFTHNYVDQLQPLVEHLPYDTTKELITVWRLNYDAGYLAVRSDKPWNTLEEMLTYAKKNPGKLTYGHTGNWGVGFTTGAFLFSEAGADVNYVPYQGGGPTMQAGLSGDCDVIIGGLQLMPYYKDKTLRFLASVYPERQKEAPEVPTLNDLGYSTPPFFSRIIMAPRGTPDDRLAILRQAFRKLYDDETFKKLMTSMGQNMEYMDGPEYEKLRPQQKKQYKALVEKITGEKITDQ